MVGQTLTQALSKEQQELRELREKVAAFEAAQAAKFRIKVSEKGAVSVYGLGKWPVTLYKSQWISLLGHAQAILAFIKANDSVLKVKGV